MDDIFEVVHALALPVLKTLPPDASPDDVRKRLEIALAPVSGSLSNLKIEGEGRQTDVCFTIPEDRSRNRILYLR